MEGLVLHRLCFPYWKVNKAVALMDSVNIKERGLF